MTRLQDLYTQQRQSPWLDNLRRGWITSGELERWVERGVRGITSNPSIFQKAIEGNVDYDDQLRGLVADDVSVTDSYWDLVTADIRDALGHPAAGLRPQRRRGRLRVGRGGSLAGPRHRGHDRGGPPPPHDRSPSPTST